MRVAVDADFAEVLQEWVEVCAEEGIRIHFTSGYRSVEHQARLRKTLAGPVAAPGRSYHNYGLAVDFIASPKRMQRRAGEIAEELGLRWGGRFSPSDPVHIDAGNFLTIEEAKTEGYPITLVEVE